MQILTCLSIITLAALVHASFQLSTSVLTLLSGHSLSAKHSHAKLLRLSYSFLAGVGIMTLLLLSSIALILLNLCRLNFTLQIWALVCGLLVGAGIAIWIFYYRRHKRGTTLWIPRGLANYLTRRTSKTQLSAEAFGLGLSSVFSELLFIIAPMLAAAIALLYLPAGWQLVGIVLYVVVSMLSIIIITILVSRGHSLSRIQNWRETNKHFLQFIGGSGCIILGFFISVNVAANAVAGLL